MKHIKIITILLVFLCGQLIAQPMEVDKVLAAQKEMEKQEYYTALKWLIDAHEDGEDNIEDNVEVIHNIAMLYHKLRNYRKAATWYKRVMKKDKEGKYPNTGYYLGQALKISGKYAESKTAFDTYIASAQDDKLKALAAIEKAGIELAESLPEAGEETKVQNKTTSAFNTAYTEWSPFMASPTELYYTGLSSDKLVVKKEAKGNYFSKLYKTTFDGKKWSEGKELPAPINMYGVHTGNVTMSADGKQLYFTRCLMVGQTLQTCDIYVSENNNGTYSKPVKVSGINEDTYTSKQPAYGKVNGQEALFFTSNMPGSKDWDIYYAIKKSATEFEAPIRLSDNINTIADDETPFFHGDRLYFASNGHPSIGGYDIFTAEQDGLDFKKAENLGKGINTAADELYYVLDESGYNGFVVSNRKKSKNLGEGETFDKEDRWRTSGDDIFQVTYDIPIIANLDVRTYDKGKTPVKGMTVTLIDLETGKRRSQFNPRGNKFAFPLDNEKKYRVVATIDCFYADSTVVSTEGIKKSKTLLTEMFLAKVPPTITKRVTKRSKPITKKSPIILKSILFDFNKSNIRLDAQPELQQLAKFMTENPTMVIELSSHTDSRGNDAYNERLSQRRANSSKNYLVQERGIAADRIVAVGKGEKELLNRCADGVKCEDDEHQVNRRTEFKIISGADSIVTDVFEQELEDVEEIIETPCVPTEKGSTGMVNPDDVNPPTMKEMEELPATEMVFNKEVHNFGEIKKGEKVEHIFTFTNNGKVDLQVEFAAGSCGCTVPAFPKDPIPPGGSGSIKVVYDSSDKEVGKVDKQTITVIANTEPIVTEVTIQAKIVD